MREERRGRKSGLSWVFLELYQPRLKIAERGANRSRRRAACKRTASQRRFESERGAQFPGERRGKFLQSRQRHFPNGSSFLFRRAQDLSSYFMRIAERHTKCDEEIGEFGGDEDRILRRLA